MKLLTIRLALALATAFAASLTGLPTAHAQDVAVDTMVVPGTAAAQLVRAQVQVLAVDLANRVLTLKGPSGRSFSLEVDPAVQRFGEVKPGDWIQISYYEAVAVKVTKGGDGIRERIESEGAASAPAGSAPTGAAMRQVTIISDIWAISTKKHTVHVRGPRGHIVEIKVRDPKRLKGLKVGDQVELTYVVGGAVQLEPIPAPITTAKPKPVKP